VTSDRGDPGRDGTLDVPTATVPTSRAERAALQNLHAFLIAVLSQPASLSCDAVLKFGDSAVTASV